MGTPGPALLPQLARALEERRAQGLWRIRRTLSSPQGPRVQIDGREILAFASNDYLGLANDSAVTRALSAGARDWGAGAGASHLVAGHFAPHAALERELAAFVAPCAHAHALTFATGYLANLALICALANREDVVFADKLNHASLNDAALLSRARLIRYPHGDVEALAARLRGSSARHKLIATDAVFSMDGDLAPLPALFALAEAHDALLVIDDAHGFGVLGGGRGSLAHFALRSERIVYMGTLGKAAGVAGAFVAAHPLVIETLVQMARPYIYTTAAPPALAAAQGVAVERVRNANAERAHLQRLIARFRHGALDLPWRLLDSMTAIQPLVVGDAAASVKLAEALYAQGVWVPAIRPPTVPAGTARLRVSLSSAHSDADIDRLLDALHMQAASCA